MVYVVYILKSINFRKTYVGSTGNFVRRFSEHNLGKSTYTKRYKPWKVIYKEICNTLAEARNREKYLKSKNGRQWIKKNLFS